MQSPVPRYPKNYDYLFKIILIGDSGVGKTSLLAQFVGEEVVKSHISTIGTFFCFRGYPFSTYAKFSPKLAFLTP